MDTSQQTAMAQIDRAVVDAGMYADGHTLRHAGQYWPTTRPMRTHCATEQTR